MNFMTTYIMKVMVLDQIRILLSKIGLAEADYAYGSESVIGIDGTTMSVKTRVNMDIVGPNRKKEYLMTPELLGNSDIVPYWSSEFDSLEFSHENYLAAQQA